MPQTSNPGERHERQDPEKENKVRVLILQLEAGLPLPAHAYPGDAGFDLYAAEDAKIFAGQRELIRTGVAIALPTGFVGLIHPRSGLATTYGLTVLNAPGTIDASYRGEIFVNLINHDPVRTATITKGSRIAQLLIQSVADAQFEVVETLPPTTRATARHGSTDKA